jgi:hypothetical protein
MNGAIQQPRSLTSMRRSLFGLLLFVTGFVLSLPYLRPIAGDLVRANAGASSPAIRQAGRMASGCSANGRLVIGI